jgi:hypothetical protein
MKQPTIVLPAIFLALACGTASAGKLIRSDAWGGGVIPTFSSLDPASIDPGVSGPHSFEATTSPNPAIYTSSMSFGPLADEGIMSGALVSQTNGNYNAVEYGYVVGNSAAAVFVYTLAQTGDTVGGTTVTAADQTKGEAYLGGDTEIQFNYNPTAFTPASIAFTDLVQSPASFTYGGVTYQSIGSTTPLDTNNDFFFNSGHLVGYLNDAGTFVAESTLDSGSGWTVSPAPEIDPTSGVSALELLAGSLAVFASSRARRRMKATLA